MPFFHAPALRFSIAKFCGRGCLICVINMSCHPGFLISFSKFFWNSSAAFSSVNLLSLPTISSWVPWYFFQSLSRTFSALKNAPLINALQSGSLFFMNCTTAWNLLHLQINSASSSLSWKGFFVIFLIWWQFIIQLVGKFVCFIYVFEKKNHRTPNSIRIYQRGFRMTFSIFFYYLKFFLYC